MEKSKSVISESALSLLRLCQRKSAEGNEAVGINDVIPFFFLVAQTSINHARVTSSFNLFVVKLFLFRPAGRYAPVLLSRDEFAHGTSA